MVRNAAPFRPRFHSPRDVAGGETSCVPVSDPNGSPRFKPGKAIGPYFPNESGRYSIQVGMPQK